MVELGGGNDVLAELPPEIDGAVTVMARKEVRRMVEELARKRIAGYLRENAEDIKLAVKASLDEKIRVQVQAAIADALPGTIDEVASSALAKKWG